jgi:hypothetical protein
MRNMSVAEIHHKLMVVYGEDVTSLQNVAKWSTELQGR